MLIFAGVFVYSAVMLVGEWLDRQKNIEEREQAIEDFLVFDDFEIPDYNETSPPTTLSPDSAPIESSATAQTVPGAVTEPDASEDETQTTTATTANKPPAPPKPTSIWPQFSLNWTAMQNTNPEIYGWIWVYNTTISYPLLHTTDNEKYVTTAYNGTYSSLGSIFLDYRASKDMTSRNSIIYGHNGNNGIKFEVLLSYKKQSFYENHKYISIITKDQGLLKYEIFSAYIVDAYSPIYRVNFSGDNAFAVYLNDIRAKSLITTDVEVSPSDNIVTLSTCTNNRLDKDERLVVHARLMTETP